MADLVDEVKASFEFARKDQLDEAGFRIVEHDDRDFPVGFEPMREYYTEQIMNATRHGYRHFAGAELPTEPDELLARTGEQMYARLIAVLMQAFTDGVQLGQASEHKVRMAIHFDKVEHLFHDPEWRQEVSRMAQGFAADDGVLDYFKEYTQGALHHLCHVTGFDAGHIRPAKVWDLWLMIGTATITASYLAGHRLGESWKERDVLDGIEIATEEEL